MGNASTSILFQFADRRSADLAYDTLNELGYEPVHHEDADDHILHIHIDHRDLTSALEIAQSHGGTLVDSSFEAKSPLYSSAYGLEQIMIPAHTVNEDWTGEYAGSDPNDSEPYH